MESHIAVAAKFFANSTWKCGRMNRLERRQFDVLVVGGGPAGMAAATRAGEAGLQVGIVDDNFILGGQIWRQSLGAAPESECATWSERLRAAGASVIRGRVFQQPEAGLLLAEHADGLYELGYRKLILATGAREKFLPFPGWTLPNVVGVGGLQAMVKSGLPVRGKRVVLCGSGPLLLAVAAYLLKHGADVPLVGEQASWKDLSRFGLMLLQYPSKITQALRLKQQLRGVAFKANCWPVAVHGESAVESVSISQGGRVVKLECDYLACGFHLVPNLELPRLVGCRIDNDCVVIDRLQRTTVAETFCAGEPTGIGGLELALVEGQIAGLAAAGRTSNAEELFPEREKLHRFARSLARTFHLRPELRALPSPDTTVCRCEDVSYSRLRQYTSCREAKLQSRFGMGPCQGRICGPAANFLLRWDADSMRPPILPVRVGSMAACQIQQTNEALP
jgi:D-hydroxyproline dehydrogenase subunit alpha